MTNPQLITTPFAENGTKNIIPEGGAPEPQLATMQAGFPEITQRPINEGGIPPERADFNGILNLYGQHLVHMNKGLAYEFDQDFANSIGGYPLNARTMLSNGDIVQNTQEGNTNNPNLNMGGWKSSAVSKDVTIPTYKTADDGVNPVTGVANGAYFNVRSEDDDTVAVEYQNVGGSAVATGKSYPSDNALAKIISRDSQVLNLVSDFGAVGGTDCTDQIREAIESAIQTGLPLYIPTTTLPYLYRVAVLSFTFANLSANKSLTIFGDGEGSCFKCMDGQIVERWGQSFRFAPSQDVDSIYIKNIKIDNNARGSEPPPPDNPYAFEQTATIATSPSLGVTIKNVTYENVVIVDPSADGFNDSGSGKIENLRYINIVERDRTRVRASILMAHTAKKLVIINPIVSAIESEPTNSPTNESATIQIIKGQVKSLDLSQKNETDVVSYYVSGLIVSDFCNLSTLTNLVIDGGALRVSTGRNNFPYLRRAVFRNLTLKFPYNPDTGVVTGLNFLRRAGEGQKSYIEFDNANFEIDYAGDLPIPTTNYLIGNVSGTAISAASAPNHVLTIKNSRFDPRAAHAVSAYRIGTVDLINNNYGGTNAAIVWGTSNNSYATILKVVGGDFSAVTGAALSFIGSVGSASSLTLSGDWFGLNASKYVLQSGTISNFASFIKNTRYIVADVLPTSALTKDVFKVGTAAATVGTVIEYQCTASSATAPTFICSKQLGMYEAVTASLPTLTAKEKWAKAFDTTTNTIKTWTGTAWI